MVKRRFEGKKNGAYAITLSVIIMLLALGLFTLYYERGITGLILKRKTAWDIQYRHNNHVRYGHVHRRSRGWGLWSKHCAICAF
jgi:hypothetical protein